MVSDQQDTAATADCTPRRRVVLLGASNLTRGISTVVQTARLQAGGRLEVLAALGHGRSYGLESTVLGRTLPAITTCGLWDALAEGSPAETVALLTDIGNDLVYEVPVARIVSWIDACLDRLGRIDARIVMTLPPIANVRTLSAWRYMLFRTVLFPACRLRLETMKERAYELNEQLIRLGQRRAVALVEPRGDWYGMDPIHIKISTWPRAWREIFTPLDDRGATVQPAARSFGRWLYLRRLAPEYRRLFGMEIRRRQPTGRLADGTTIGFY